MPKRTYTTEEVEAYKAEIVERLEKASLVQILKSPREDEDSWPAYSTVMLWQSQDADFRRECAHAREAFIESEADSIVAIADDTSIPSDHKKYMISAREWTASKRAPHKFGDRLTIENKIDDARAFEAFGAALADAGISEEQTQKVLDLTAQHLQALK